MGARVESLPIPVGRSARRFSWVAVVVLALSTAAAAGIFALQRGSSEKAAPPISVVRAAPAQAITGTRSGLIQVARAAQNLAAHQNSGFVTGSGPGLAELAKDFGAYENSGPVVGTGPGLEQLGPNDRTCRRIIRPRC
jgi:hypothetical protein